MTITKTFWNCTRKIFWNMSVAMAVKCVGIALEKHWNYKALPQVVTISQIFNYRH
jgi:hypothetical protein